MLAALLRRRMFTSHHVLPSHSLVRLHIHTKHFILPRCTVLRVNHLNVCSRYNAVHRPVPESLAKKRRKVLCRIDAVVADKIVNILLQRKVCWCARHERLRESLKEKVNCQSNGSWSLSVQQSDCPQTVRHCVLQQTAEHIHCRRRHFRDATLLQYERNNHPSVVVDRVSLRVGHRGLAFIHFRYGARATFDALIYSN